MRFTIVQRDTVLSICLTGSVGFYDELEGCICIYGLMNINFFSFISFKNMDLYKNFWSLSHINSSLWSSLTRFFRLSIACQIQ